jgi:hypothetical protein
MRFIRSGTRTETVDVPRVRLTTARQFRRFATAIALTGVIVQLALTTYYLGIAHAPRARSLPVGVIAQDAQARQLTATLNTDGSYRPVRYDDAVALVEAIERREVYGGIDLSEPDPQLYLASAASPTVATLLRTTYAAVRQEQHTALVATLTKQGGAVPLATAQALAAAPRVVDVAPLPPDDRNGGSLGLLVQALALGGSIASLGLGRLVPRTRRSWKRGLGHLATLLVYALGSGGAVLGSMLWFGVGDGADLLRLFGGFALISLAITGSTAGLVAVVGPLGSAAGFIYFVVGTIVSGASIPPEFLPGFGHALGGALPTGAGVQVVRDSLYFPDAPLRHPLTILALYACLGALAVLITNVLPNRGDRTSELDIPLPGAHIDDERVPVRPVVVLPPPPRSTTGRRAPTRPAMTDSPGERRR